MLLERINSEARSIKLDDKIEYAAKIPAFIKLNVTKQISEQVHPASY